MVQVDHRAQVVHQDQVDHRAQVVHQDQVDLPVLQV